MIFLCVSYPDMIFAAPPDPITCTVSVTGVAFGGINPMSFTAATSMGTLSISCTVNGTQNVDYTIALSRGAGTFIQRRMILPTTSHFLNYNLYTANNYATIWGDGTSGTVTVTGRERCHKNCTFTKTIYGQLPLPQAAAFIGTYSDAITVTVTY